MQKRKFFLNLFILVALFGLVITGWVAGHIYRYSIPEFQPPREPIPGVKIGFLQDEPTQLCLGLPITNWDLPS